MAGTRRKASSSKKKRGVRKVPKASLVNNQANPTDIQNVLSQADSALESSNIEDAMQLFTYAAGGLRNKMQMQAADLAATDEDKEADALLLSKVLGKMAEAKVSMGDQQGGQQDFLEATNLLSVDSSSNNPIAQAQWKEARASLYLYLGQLSSSSDALEAFTRAITDLKACAALLDEALKCNSSDENLQHTLVEIRRQLCGGYCSVAELYLTDLCFEENAEQSCESALEAALKLDDPTSSPDAVQAMANLRLSQCRGFEAVAFMLEAYNRVKVGCEAMADLVGLGGDQGKNVENEETAAKELKGEALDATNSLPGFEFRCQMAKLLLECASILEDVTNDGAKRIEQRQRCVEGAVQVLGSLLAENDEVIEIWFLLGCAFASIEPKSDEASKYYFETALDMLEKVKKGLKGEMPTDEVKDEIKDVKQKIKDVKHRLDDISKTGNTAMEED